jgi:hypothetical protein
MGVQLPNYIEGVLRHFAVKHPYTLAQIVVGHDAGIAASNPITVDTSDVAVPVINISITECLSPS